MMSMTRRDPISELHQSLRDQHHFIASKRDSDKSTTSVTHRLFRTFEVGAGSAAVGLLAGRTGTTSIGSSGVPVGLVAGGALHAAAFFGLAGGYSDHLHNVADGAIAGWLALWGAGQGSQMRCKADASNCGPIVSGERGGPQGPSPEVPQIPQYFGPPAKQMGAPPVSPYQHQRSPYDNMGGANYYGNRGPGPLTEAELAAISRGMPRAA